MSQSLKYTTAACVISVAGLAMLFAFSPQPARAQCETFDPVGDPFGVKCGEATGLTAKDPRFVVGTIINVALSLLGILATVLIVYAGFKWMTAGGNEENVKSAQKILMAAVIGLVIILAAYAISSFVLRSLYQATTGGAYPG